MSDVGLATLLIRCAFQRGEAAKQHTSHSTSHNATVYSTQQHTAAAAAHSSSSKQQHRSENVAGNAQRALLRRARVAVFLAAVQRDLTACVRACASFLVCVCVCVCVCPAGFLVGLVNVGLVVVWWELHSC